MTSTGRIAHILALEIRSPDDRARSLALLDELVRSTGAFRRASEAGRVAKFPTDGGEIIVFEDAAEAVPCGLEIWERLLDQPTVEAAIGLHSGPISISSDASGARRVSGEGVDGARALAARADTGTIVYTKAFEANLGRREGSQPQSTSGPSDGETAPQRVFILDAPEADANRTERGNVRKLLAASLSADGHHLANEPRNVPTLEWARSFEHQIRSADTVLAIVSEAALDSDVFRLGLEISHDEQCKRGRPQIMPVWLTDDAVAEGTFGWLGQCGRQAIWRGAEDTDRLVAAFREALAGGQVERESPKLDSFAGAVRADSNFYLERPADRDFEAALHDHESIVLVKGPRQIGKTSLIGCGIRLARQRGWRVFATDFQALSRRQMEDEEAFYRALAATLSLELDIPYDPGRDWIPDLGPTLNLGRFFRAAVASSNRALVWFIDEADRLFEAPFSSGFFGLVRSWHNARAMDPGGPWSRLTIVIGYATEAHLFIENLNQSPFNVGRPVALTPFTREHTEELNRRYGSPLASPSEVDRLHSLVGGQPFLTQRAFDTLVRGQATFVRLVANADQEDGPFGDHLKRILVSVTQLPAVCDALRQSLAAAEIPDSKGLQRLVAAGVLVPRPPNRFELPCELYRRFLSRYLGGSGTTPSGVTSHLVEQPAPGSASEPDASRGVCVSEELMADLVRLRKRRKIGQGAIAQALGISQSRVSQIENTKGEVALESVLAYSRAIGASIMAIPE